MKSQLKLPVGAHYHVTEKPASVPFTPEAPALHFHPVPPLQHLMCFPNENKRSPASLRQPYSGIWDQIKASVEAEKRNEMASEGRCTK